MSHRLLAPVFAAVALAVLVPGGAMGQEGVGSSSPSPRTPWGEPDLQGLWTSATLTPLERPRRLADKTSLTDEEAAAMEQQTIENWAANDGKAPPGSVGGYNQVWLDSGSVITDSRRTSLIVDPPDGAIPWAPGAKEIYEGEVARYGVGPFDTWTDMDTGERCITDGLPNMVPLQPYNSFGIVARAQVIGLVAELLMFLLMGLQVGIPTLLHISLLGCKVNFHIIEHLIDYR